MERVDRHIRLTERSAAGWGRLMARYNVTLTTLIEAIGELLDDGEDPVPEKAVRRAQQLDRERRSRR